MYLQKLAKIKRYNPHPHPVSLTSLVSRRVALNQNSTGQKILCPTCGFATTDPGSLTRHRKRRHGYNPKTRQDHPERSTSKPNKSSSRHEPYKRDRPHALYCGTIDIAPSDSQTSLDSLFLPNLESSSSSSSSHNLDDILFPAFPSSDKDDCYSFTWDKYLGYPNNEDLNTILFPEKSPLTTTTATATTPLIPRSPSPKQLIPGVDTALLEYHGLSRSWQDSDNITLPPPPPPPPDTTTTTTVEAPIFDYPFQPNYPINPALDNYPPFHVEEGSIYQGLPDVSQYYIPCDLATYLPCHEAQQFVQTIPTALDPAIVESVAAPAGEYRVDWVRSLQGHSRLTPPPPELDFSTSSSSSSLSSLLSSHSIFTPPPPSLPDSVLLESPPCFTPDELDHLLKMCETF